MIRNGIGFWFHYNAYNGVTNKGESGDVANHHLKFVIDGVETAPNNTPEAIALDEYRIFVDPAESNGAKLIRLGGISDTPDVYIISADVITDLLIPGTPFVGCYTAWDGDTNAPKLADAGNHSMFIAQDNTVSAAPGQSEVNASTLPGTYKVAGTGPQSDGNAVSIIGESTGNTNVIPTEIAPYNEDQAAESNVLLGVVYAEGTLTGTAETTIKGPIKLLKLDTGIKVIKI